jgi:hypothetical protein
MRRGLDIVAPNLVSLVAWPAGLPWPAVFALGLSGLMISAGLAWLRFQHGRTVEQHRHAEVMATLAQSSVLLDSTAVINNLRHPTISDYPP